MQKKLMMYYCDIVKNPRLCMFEKNIKKYLKKKKEYENKFLL